MRVATPTKRLQCRRGWFFCVSCHLQSGCIWLYVRSMYQISKKHLRLPCELTWFEIMPILDVSRSARNFNIYIFDCYPQMPLRREPHVMCVPSPLHTCYFRLSGNYPNEFCSYIITRARENLTVAKMSLQKRAPAQVRTYHIWKWKFQPLYIWLYIVGVSMYVSCLRANPTDANVCKNLGAIFSSMGFTAKFSNPIDDFFSIVIRCAFFVNFSQ